MYIVNLFWKYFGNGHKILDYPCFNSSLFLGNATAATNEKWLKDNDIDKILNVTPYDYQYPDAVQVVQVPHIDNDHHLTQVKMYKKLPHMIDLVRTWLKEGKNVLVHCKAGVNRSPTVVIAYLVQYHDMSVQDATKLVREQRPAAYFFGNNFEKALLWFAENK